MRIDRNGELRTRVQFLDCRLYVRKDFTVVYASEWYYDYIRENSYLPLCELLLSEDEEILRDAIGNLTEPVELYTRITNRREEGFRNIYLRLENCERTEDGKPLYLITLWDVADMEARLGKVEKWIEKYRHFMTVNNEYYFEYTLPDNRLNIYKYVNHRAISVLNSDLDEFMEKYQKDDTQTKEQREQVRTFCAYLKAGSDSFEMEFTIINEDGSFKCGAKGGTFGKEADMVAGIFLPDQMVVKEAYYLSPAAKDAGTGLLNKRAASEFAIERLQAAGGKTCWLLIMDIDDFKNVNDSFGHLFGDQVIRKVADTVRLNVGNRGVVGRFGGDEFFVLLYRVETRTDLKTLLKTITKELLYAFDTKLKITASIGVSQYPKDGDDFEELFEKADKALYIAKEKGKDRHIIYDEKLHGAYTKDSIQTQAVAYALSREKRRRALVNVISNIYRQGAGYVTEHPEVQRDIMGLFDLDGFAVYGDGGKTVLCRSGSYICEAPDTNGELAEAGYLELFGTEDLFVETSTSKMQTTNPGIYPVMRRQEIGATLRCLARKDGEPFAMIHFDVFNRNRKWSDMDIEMLGLVGFCLGGQLCEESTQGGASVTICN